MSLLLQLGTELRNGLASLEPSQIPLCVEELLDPATTDETRAEFLTALAARRETPEELAQFALALLPAATDPGFHGLWKGQRLLDCCGSGGGGLDLFNVSTGLMFVVAAIGIPVVKHGNRGVTKKSGSADVLEKLGIKIEVPPEHLARGLDEVGAAFLFAPLYHPAFKIVAPVRHAMAAEGKRTIFNLLGPLLNPCRPASQMTGVFQQSQVSLYGHAMEQLHRERFSVIYGVDADNKPIGEASISGKTVVYSRGGKTESIPASLDIPTSFLCVESVEESACRIYAILSGEDTGPAAKLLILNAALAMTTQGMIHSLAEGLATAEQVIRSGKALAVLGRWQAFSDSL